MTNTTTKAIIDAELNSLVFNEALKSRVRNHVMQHSKSNVFPVFLRRVAACFAILMLCGTTVYAGYYIFNKISVNDEVLPALDEMEVVEVNRLNAKADEYGVIKINFNDYDDVSRILGVNLLNTNLSNNNAYMLGNITTNSKDYLMIQVDNYILGDTSGYKYIPEENRYEYTSGYEYASPISLSVDIILSEDQKQNGWETDYLGLYKFAENYTSAQGYRVDLVEDTVDGNEIENYVSEKCAVFVADGIRYTLRGRVSTEEMKNIVDSMKYGI